MIVSTNKFKCSSLIIVHWHQLCPLTVIAWDRPDVIIESQAHCHLISTTCRQTALAGPAGSVLSSAHDMAIWLQFLINKGVTASGERLISEEVFLGIFDEQMAGARPMSDRDLTKPTFPVSDITAAYDLGWITSYYRGLFSSHINSIAMA